MAKILIWDAEGKPPEGFFATILWRGFEPNNSSDCISILQLLEENADTLKSRYLAWIYELGESTLQGRRLVDHLQMRPGFSYWWMTLLAEKCNIGNATHINDAIRFLGFTDWASGRSLECITLASANAPLADCLRGWCKKNGVAFEWQRLPVSVVPMSLARRVYVALPLTLQPWAWLVKYLWSRWPLRGVGVPLWRQSRGRRTFVTYSANCVPEAVQNDRYESRYWAHLPDLMEVAEIPSNWLHLYCKDPTMPTVEHAAVSLNAFNKSEQGRQSHVALDSFIDIKVILSTMRDYLRLFRIGLRTRAVLKPTQTSLIDLWPLLRADWLASMSGADAMNKLLILNLFEAALKALPSQQLGVYLQENMGWEFSFIHAWRAAGHGRLIGVPHTTVRFWDLRYFFDRRSYPRKGLNDLPLPDRVACNGPVMRTTYLQGGYPDSELLDLEALRYLHLEQTQRATKPVSDRVEETVRLLVLGDYLPDNTLLQMRLLEQAVSLFPQQLSITVKPHPICPIQPADYPRLHMQICMEPVAALLAECDVAFTSATTSAAVDAYCAGIPVVSVLDPNTLNLSPLRGYTGVLFVSTPEALANALVSALTFFPASDTQRMFFTVNGRLANWRRLLL